MKIPYISVSQVILLLPFLLLFFFSDWQAVTFYLLIGACICIAGIISLTAISYFTILKYFQTKAKDRVFFNHNKKEN